MLVFVFGSSRTYTLCRTIFHLLQLQCVVPFLRNHAASGISCACADWIVWSCLHYCQSLPKLCKTWVAWSTPKGGESSAWRLLFQRRGVVLQLEVTARDTPFVSPNRNPSALFVSSWIVRTCSLHRRYSESVFSNNWRNCDLVSFRVDICTVSLRDAIVLWHWITVMVVRRVKPSNVCAGLSSGLRSVSAVLLLCLGLRNDAF